MQLCDFRIRPSTRQIRRSCGCFVISEFCRRRANLENSDAALLRFPTSTVGEEDSEIARQPFDYIRAGPLPEVRVRKFYSKKNSLMKNSEIGRLPLDFRIL
jgi:hypothetical protein